MKKRFFVFSLLVIVALFFFYKKSDQPETSVETQSTVMPARFKKTIPSSPVRAPASALVSPKALPSPSPIEDDSYCQSEVQAQVENNGDFLKRQAPLLTQKVGSWYFEKRMPTENDSESTPSGKFLLALANSGLLSGMKPKTKTLDESIGLLAEVHEEDLANSAPLFYMAYLQHQQGLFDDEILTLKKLSKTDHYNSYVTGIVRDLHSSVRTPSDWINTLSIVAQIPVPEYGGEISKYMIGRKLEILGKQMLQTEYHRSSTIPDIDSLNLETAVGWQALLKIQPNRTDIPPTSWFKRRLRYDLGPEWGVFSSKSTGCDLNFYWPFIHELQDKLKNGN